MTARSLAVLSDLSTEVDSILAKYPNTRSATLPLLFLAQSVEGHVSSDGMRDVAQILGITPAEVLSVASFYTMLKKTETGEYLISVCRNITCTHRGGRKVLQAFEDKLGVPAGGTTPDGRFTLEAAECLATCDGAPSLQINYEDFYNVSPEKVAELVGKLAGRQGVKSVVGAPVKTHKEISREVALTGTMHKIDVRPATERTVGGESPPADLLPGTRPQVPGVGADG